VRKPLDSLIQLCHNSSMSSQPIPIPVHPPSIPLVLDLIQEARAQLSPSEFRLNLRRALLAHPDLKLKHVATRLGVTRQRVSLLVGRLNRPTCTSADRAAPKRDQAAEKMAFLKQRVALGESAQHAAAQLQISLNQARTLGFKVRQVRSAHGKGRQDCNCWRCRRALGVTLPRGLKSGSIKQSQVLDWLAYRDPDTNEPLTQAQIGRLAGVAQPMVSRIARKQADLS